MIQRHNMVLERKNHDTLSRPVSWKKCPSDVRPRARDSQKYTLIHSYTDICIEIYRKHDTETHHGFGEKKP